MGHLLLKSKQTDNFPTEFLVSSSLLKLLGFRGRTLFEISSFTSKSRCYASFETRRWISKIESLCHICVSKVFSTRGNSAFKHLVHVFVNCPRFHVTNQLLSQAVQILPAFLLAFKKVYPAELQLPSAAFRSVNECNF